MKQTDTNNSVEDKRRFAFDKTNYIMDCHCSVIFILTVQKVVIDRILNTILHQQIICRLIAPVSFISEG